MHPSPSVHRREVAGDSKSPAERRPYEPWISAEAAGQKIDHEQEADDDAVPHQVDVKAGLRRCAFARAVIGLALGVILELRRRRQIILGIEADATIFLSLTIEPRAHSAIVACALRLEFPRHPG